MRFAYADFAQDLQQLAVHLLHLSTHLIFIFIIIDITKLVVANIILILIIRHLQLLRIVYEIIILVIIIGIMSIIILEKIVVAAILLRITATKRCSGCL